MLGHSGLISRSFHSVLTSFESLCTSSEEFTPGFVSALLPFRYVSVLLLDVDGRVCHFSASTPPKRLMYVRLLLIREADTLCKILQGSISHLTRFTQTSRSSRYASSCVCASVSNPCISSAVPEPIVPSSTIRMNVAVSSGSISFR